MSDEWITVDVDLNSLICWSMFFSWRSQVAWACAWLVMSVSICRTRGCVAALTVCATSSAAVPATSSLRTSSALSRRNSCTCLQHVNSHWLCACRLRSSFLTVKLLVFDCYQHLQLLCCMLVLTLFWGAKWLWIIILNVGENGVLSYSIMEHLFTNLTEFTEELTESKRLHCKTLTFCIKTPTAKA